jgi:hypothetical protein
MNVKMTLTFPDETIALLKEKAESEGFLKPQGFARFLVVQALKKGLNAEITDDCGKRVYRLAVEQPEKIEAYVKAKRLGSVSVFANYAMELAMSRAPLTEAQKKLVDTTDEK